MRNHDMVALLSQHTARPPMISFSGAIRLLEAFGRTAAPLLPCEQRRRVDAELEGAALAFLTYHFTPLLVSIDDNFGDAFEAAGLVLRHASAPTQQRFLEEIVLNSMHPGNHLLFATMVRRTIPPATLEQTLFQYAASGNELHAYNVLWLLHYLNTPTGCELGVIAARLVARAETNRYLREAAVVALQITA